MKILASIRSHYATQSVVARRIQKKVLPMVRGKILPRWHYESRVKSLESFALKVETGRFDPTKLDDVFACTVVVSNHSEVGQAEKLIAELFEVSRRRPEAPSVSYNQPSNFAFDDLRLRARLRVNDVRHDVEMSHYFFEVQIKTFLAHAWAVATHDLIYKAGHVNWGKERVAHQIRAMLQHAEASIEAVETMAKSEMLAKTDRKTEAVRQCISMIDELWNEERLPGNVRRVAESIIQLSNAVGVKLEDLRSILVDEKHHGRGPANSSVSPYYATLEALLQHRRDDLKAALSTKKVRLKVIWPPEISLPDDWDVDAMPNLDLLTPLRE